MDIKTHQTAATLLNKIKFWSDNVTEIQDAVKGQKTNQKIILRCSDSCSDSCSVVVYSVIGNDVYSIIPFNVDQLLRIALAEAERNLAEVQKKFDSL
jgi:hypothetical protein